MDKEDNSNDKSVEISIDQSESDDEIEEIDEVDEVDEADEGEEINRVDNNTHIENESNINNDNTPIKKIRKKRRTKDEIEGRNFICELCSKAYLSYPALTNHRKAKHNSNNPDGVIESNSKKTARGRPKKNLYMKFISDYEENMKNFFDTDKRKSKLMNNVENFENLENIEKVDETNNTNQSNTTNNNNVTPSNNITNKSNIVDINSLLNSIKEKIFTEVYEVYAKITQPTDNTYKSHNDHPFLKLININEETETDNNSDNSNTKTIDEAFSKFIKNSIAKTNEDYLYIIFKYTILFREYINTFNTDDSFTQVNYSESIPTYTNTFFHYLQDKNFFDLIPHDTDKVDIVEWIMYLCYWLLENGYTSTKITLYNIANNNKAATK